LSSSDDGDCDAPSASSAAHHATTLAHRILSPVPTANIDNNSAEKSLKAGGIK
uniref:Pecanex-like protein n=1 Tax=Gongylonema pulchrum TaxID=637853 RepID=A0A183DMH0_9BILA